jgi:hypothetical protein
MRALILFSLLFSMVYLAGNGWVSSLYDKGKITCSDNCSSDKTDDGDQSDGKDEVRVNTGEFLVSHALSLNVHLNYSFLSYGRQHSFFYEAPVRRMHLEPPELA